MTLFDGQKEEFRLYDAMRMRFVPKLAPRSMTAEDANAANDYYVKSSCPHLQWKNDVEQRVKSYTIKR